MILSALGPSTALGHLVNFGLNPPDNQNLLGQSLGRMNLGDLMMLLSAIQSQNTGLLGTAPAFQQLMAPPNDPLGQKVTPRVGGNRKVTPNRFTPNPKTPRNLAIERDKAARVNRDKRAQFNAWNMGVRGPGEGR